MRITLLHIFTITPIELITKPSAIVTPKIPNITLIEFGFAEGITFKIGACGFPKSPVTKRANGFKTSSVPKNSPVISPIMQEVQPTPIKIGANLFHPPTFITFLAIKRPTKNITRP